MDYNLHDSALGFDQPKIKVINCIKSYKEFRSHASCDYLTPNVVHLKS